MNTKVYLQRDAAASPAHALLRLEEFSGGAIASAVGIGALGLGHWGDAALDADLPGWGALRRAGAGYEERQHARQLLSRPV